MLSKLKWVKKTTTETVVRVRKNNRINIKSGICLVFLSFVCRFWEGEAVHLDYRERERERWTLLLSICSPVHLWNAQALGLKPPRLKIGQISITSWPIRRLDPYLIPQVGLPNRQAGRESGAFMESQPMGAQRCDPALKQGQPELCGVCWAC